MNANFRIGRKYTFTVVNTDDAYISSRPLIYKGVVNGNYKFSWLDGSGYGQECHKSWLKKGLVTFKEVK